MTRARGSIRRIGVAAMASILALSLFSSVAAHEHREVGEFEFTVGFMNEPAYVDELNGIDLRIAYVDDEEPVENAHESLRAAIIFGEETKEVELRALWGQPGAYTADVIPTATGTYSFQFTGEIEGQEINETFRAGPETFSEVEDREALAFPANPPQAADETDQATAFAIAGIVAGLIGLAAGAAGYYKANSVAPKQEPARRRKAQQQAEPRQGE